MCELIRLVGLSSGRPGKAGKRSPKLVPGQEWSCCFTPAKAACFLEKDAVGLGDMA